MKQSEVMKYLKDNNKWSSSFFLEANIKNSSTEFENINITDITIIRDNNRCQWKGTSVVKTNNNEITEKGNNVKYLIMNGKEYLLVSGWDLNTLKKAYIRQSDYNEEQSLMLDSPDLGSALWGRIYGNNGNDIYNLIEQSQNIQYRKSDFLLDGLECNEIEGTCKYGKIKIIFSPERCFCPLKWEITKKSGDYFDTKLLDNIIKDWKVTFNANEIKKIDGFYIPVKGRMQHDIILKNKKNSDCYDYEISSFQTSPDFIAINAFQFDLPSNVPVTLEAAPGNIYNFNNGELIPYGPSK